MSNNGDISITLSRLDASTLDSMLTVYLSQLDPSNTYKGYIDTLEDICSKLRKEIFKGK